MRKLLVVAAGVATVASSATFAQEPRLAPEGRVLPPKPAERPATFGGVAPAHPFEPDPSGGFSRVIFETDEADLSGLAIIGTDSKIDRI